MHIDHPHISKRWSFVLQKISKQQIMLCVRILQYELACLTTVCFFICYLFVFNHSNFPLEKNFWTLAHIISASRRISNSPFHYSSFRVLNTPQGEYSGFGGAKDFFGFEIHNLRMFWRKNILAGRIFLALGSS